MADTTLITLLEKLLAEARRPELVLWDADECAAYLHLSRQEFLDTSAKHRDFPPAIRPTGRAKSRRLLWKAKDVQRWVELIARAA